MKGVVYVAFGVRALEEAGKSAFTLKKHNKLPVKILEGVPEGKVSEGLTVEQQAHWAKVSVDLWSPFEPTLLLDADTRVQGDLSLGFKILRAGWDLVLVPSVPLRPGEILWNLSEMERRQTFQELGVWRHVMLNTGVMYFNKTERIRCLFKEWRVEWLRFKDRDQGALLRALRRQPVSMWLLGCPFNSAGGDVVDHLFGRAR